MTPARRCIVFLTPGFPRDEQDTNCVPSVQNYVACFAELHPEVDVHVVAFQYPFTRRIYPWKRATVHALGGRNRKGPWRVWTWARAIRRVLRLRSETGVHLVHSFWLSECAWVGQALHTFCGIPHVASILGQDARAANRYLKLLDPRRLVLTAASAFADEVFFASTGRRADHVIPLGLDGEAAALLREPAERDIDVLGVGSLIPLKNFSLFVETVERLVPRFPGLRACIVGDGPERAALERQIAARNLGDHLRLAGRLPRPEVLRLMARSRVLLHPSRYEGQGYVFLEALAAGLYVVCFDVGFPGGTEHVSRCTSPEALQAAVARRLEAPPAHEPVAVMTMHETVQAYERVYGL